MFFSGILVPFFLDWGKITFTQIMTLQSIFVFSIFLMEVPTGAIADHFGRKTSLIIGSIIIVFVPIIYTLAPNFWIFALGEFLWATCFALMSGADEALIYDSLKKIKKEKYSKKIFGRFHSFELAALMIASPIGSILAAKYGLKFPVILMSVPFFFALFIAISLKEVKTKKKRKKQNYMKTVLSGFKYFKKHKILQTLAFDKISVAILVFMVIWLYQPLLTQLEIPIFYFGFVAAGITGIQVIILNNFEFMEKLFGSKKRYLFWSALIPGIAFIFLGINPYIIITIPLLLIIAGLGLSRQVLFQSYFNKYIKSHNRATVLSTISMVDRMSIAILYPVIGLIVEKSLNVAIIFVGVAIIICALLSRVEEKHLLD